MLLRMTERFSLYRRNRQACSLLWCGNHLSVGNGLDRSVMSGIIPHRRGDHWSSVYMFASCCKRTCNARPYKEYMKYHTALFMQNKSR